MTLPRATGVSAMSSTTGGPEARGAAKAMGLLPLIRVREPKGAMFGTLVVVQKETKPSAAAIIG